MQPLLIKLTTILLILMKQGPPTPGNGDTPIDKLSIDDYLTYGIIMAVVIAFVIIYKLDKSYLKIQNLLLNKNKTS